MEEREVGQAEGTRPRELGRIARQNGASPDEVTGTPQRLGITRDKLERRD